MSHKMTKRKAKLFLGEGPDSESAGIKINAGSSIRNQPHLLEIIAPHLLFECLP